MILPSYNTTCRLIRDKILVKLLTQQDYINLLTPNVNCSGRTAPLTSKVAFYIFIQQI